MLVYQSVIGSAKAAKIHIDGYRNRWIWTGWRASIHYCWNPKENTSATLIRQSQNQVWEGGFCLWDSITLLSGKLTWQWKISFLIGNTSSEGPFSIAMLVYQRIHGFSTLLECFLDELMSWWVHPFTNKNKKRIHQGEIAEGCPQPTSPLFGWSNLV